MTILRLCVSCGFLTISIKQPINYSNHDKIEVGQ